MKIQSQQIHIDSLTKISHDAEIVASDSIIIGRYAVIQSGFKARCRSLYIGKHCFIGENVHIGGGGCDGLNANVSIGERSLIAEGSFINCAESVTIGEHVAFGYEVQIWTHGVWQPIVDGFSKMKQLPVKIGNEVWLPSRCQVLSGVEIGDNVVVGMGSLVNKSLPDGCMAAGVPVKVIKENIYPSPISDDEVYEELVRLINIYMDIAEDKGFEPQIHIMDKTNILFTLDGEEVYFKTRTKQMSPLELSDYAEDFRDFLRRNGFPFYGGGFFKSIKPKRFLEVK